MHERRCEKSTFASMGKERFEGLVILVYKHRGSLCTCIRATNRDLYDPCVKARRNWRSVLRYSMKEPPSC